MTLPPQRLLHTRWFYANCLADYYDVPMYSERHWEILENFVALSARRGMNMLLTPIHTPPLDTAVGHYLPSTQLVDISLNDGTYRFHFSKLRRWIDMGLRRGIEKFEMAHLFTQWGAKAAPMIIASVEGNERRIFGWDTPSTSPEYIEFLKIYLRALTAALREWGIADRCYFHISDEPSFRHLDDFLAARETVRAELTGFTIMDALSDFTFYQTGAVDIPVCANDHIAPFLAENIAPLWTYYCCGQQREVANQFIAMPSRRNRILGVQLYKYDLAGFLHWGFNFYNSQYSLQKINPYEVTDAQNAFPSGDPFVVYPGDDGVPEDSIRSMVFSHAVYDLRALCLLEEKIGRDRVIELIDSEKPVTFNDYPRSDSYLETLRNEVNRLLEKETPDA